jgi:hypothetical protein
VANVTIPNVNFVPEIWAQKALQALRNNLVLATKVTRDSDVAAFTQGATLHIPVPGTFTANTKTAGSPVTLQVPTDARVDVTLNQHKEVSFLIEDILKVQTNQNLMDRYITNAVIPLAEAIETYLFGLYAGFAVISTTATPITAAILRTARKTMNDAKAPEAGRILIVTDGDEISILGDAALQNYFAWARPGAISGVTGPVGNQGGGTSGGTGASSIGYVYGFDLYNSQLVPLATQNKNLAFTKEALILAMRGMPDSGAPGVDQMVISDPLSGLTMRQTVSYSPNALGMQVTLDVLFGASVLRAADGLIVQS